jgi:hypothetical protein
MIARKQSPLQVRPVRHYRVPRYPSWQDPDPLKNPGMLPYPFRHRVVKTLLASGVVSAFLLSETACVGDQVSKYSCVRSDTLRNPFPISLSGLPYHTNAFGTGAAERLHDRDARAVLEKVFELQGVNLQRDFVFRRGNISIQVDGFDPDRKIGYVFVPLGRLGEGAIVHWMEDIRTPTKGAFVQVKDWTNDDLCTANRQKTPGWALKSFEKALSEKNPAKKDELMWQIAKELVLRNIRDYRNIPEWLKIKSANALRIKDPEIKKREIDACVAFVNLVNTHIYDSEGHWLDQGSEVISHVANALYQNGKVNGDPEKLTKVNKILLYFNKLFPEFMPDSHHKSEYELQKQQLDLRKNEILLALDTHGHELESNIDMLASEADSYLISFAEMKALDSLAQNHDVFIAPVSSFDKRLGYLYGADDPKLENIKDLDTTTDQNRWLYHEYKYSKQFKLHELERMMHQYIEWARKEGKF